MSVNDCHSKVCHWNQFSFSKKILTCKKATVGLNLWIIKSRQAQCNKVANWLDKLLQQHDHCYISKGQQPSGLEWLKHIHTTCLMVCAVFQCIKSNVAFILLQMETVFVQLPEGEPSLGSTSHTKQYAKASPVSTIEAPPSMYQHCSMTWNHTLAVKKSITIPNKHLNALLA